MKGPRARRVHCAGARGHFHVRIWPDPTGPVRDNAARSPTRHRPPMNAASLVRLIGLSAIWGASFLFMRMGAPVLGPTLLIACRVFLAAAFLAIVGAVLRKPLDVRRNAIHYLVLGAFNSALPFLLFAFAARTLSASLMAILNATAPIWGAVIGAAWTRTACRRARCWAWRWAWPASRCWSASTRHAARGRAAGDRAGAGGLVLVRHRHQLREVREEGRAFRQRARQHVGRDAADRAGRAVRSRRRDARAPRSRWPCSRSAWSAAASPTCCTSG